MFDLDSGVMSTTPTSQSSITTKFPSPTFSISSNGAQQGIAWAVRSDQFDTHGPLVLYAWDATDLTTTIYESDTNPQRDAGAPANRFATPVVTNGKVYVAANGLVDVYGLFNGEPNAAAPTITPNGGTFSASQSVTLSSATASADIYYTLDGTVPTPSSTLYTAPITINTDTTVNAIASAAGYIQSGVSSATFTFSGQTPAADFHAGQRHLSHRPACDHLGSGCQREDLLHHRWNDSVGFLDSVFGSDPGPGLPDDQGDRHRHQPAEQQCRNVGLRD